jgi:hypothetical protein
MAVVLVSDWRTCLSLLSGGSMEVGLKVHLTAKDGCLG